VTGSLSHGPVGAGAPFRYLIGIDPDPDLTPAQVQAFDEYYDTVHRPEVVAANPGFLSGHCLVAAGPASGAAAGGQGPRWLAFYVIADMASVRDYMRRDGEPAGMSYTPGPVPWTRTITTWRAMLTVTGGTADVTSGPGPVLFTAAAPDATGAGQATVFEVIEELGTGDPVPATMTVTAGPAADLAGPGHRTAWSRYYRRTEAGEES
jgi:hypothetical protein